MQQYSQLGQAEWLLKFCNSIGIMQGILFEAGAHTPKSISNSMCFIEAGWRAILVEPSEVFCREWEELSLGNTEIHNRSINYSSDGHELLLSAISSPQNIDVFFKALMAESTTS